MKYDVTEAIKQRRSVRTYEPTPIEPEKLALIRDYIPTLHNPFGIEGIKVLTAEKRLDGRGERLGTYGVIKGARNFLGLSVTNNPSSLVAGGYEFEDLVLYITSLGLGTVWLAATFSHDKFQSAMKITSGDVLAAICPYGYPKEIRLLEKMMRRACGSDSRKPWSEMFFDGTPDRPLEVTAAGRYATALEMVRLAPSATNRQPWRIIKDGDTFHFYASYKPSAAADEMPNRHIDMGIALCHFDLTLQSEGIEGTFEARQPDIAVPARFHYITSWTAKK